MKNRDRYLRIILPILALAGGALAPDSIPVP